MATASRFSIARRPPPAAVAAPRRRFGSSPALTRARAALAASATRLRAARANAGGKAGNVEAAVCTVIGGGASGVIKAKIPEVAGFDTRIPVAAAGLGAGMFVIKGKWGGRLVNAAAGMAACVISDAVEDFLDGDDGGED